MKQKLLNMIKLKINIDNPIVKKLINGMAWNVIGTIMSKVFIMIASIITARILGADKSGEYSVINSTVLMFSTFAGLGLGTTATRFVSEYKTSDKEKCGRIIGMTYLVGFVSGCVMAIVLNILAPWLARVQLNAPHLEFGLKLASILLITNTINIIQLNTLSGFEQFKNIAKLSITQGLISFPIFIVCTYFFGVNGLIFGHIVVSVLMTALYAFVNFKARSEYSLGFGFKGVFKEIDIMWKFSLPSMLSNIMVGPVTWLGNTFITATAHGYFELGIFNAANQWRTILTFIPNAVGNVILPLIIANKGEDRLERINILFGWIIVNCIAIPLLTVPELIAFLYGDEYAGNSFNVSILLVVLTCCILSYKQGIARNLVSNNLMWWGFLSNALWGVTLLTTLWFIRNWGAVGLSTSYVVAYTVSTIIFVPFYIRRGVVHRSFLISKEVLLMWIALFIQLIGTVLTSNIIVRGITLTFSMFSLYQLIKMMFKKGKLS